LPDGKELPYEVGELIPILLAMVLAMDGGVIDKPYGIIDKPYLVELSGGASQRLVEVHANHRKVGWVTMDGVLHYVEDITPLEREFVDLNVRLVQVRKQLETRRLRHE
jgi:hypothetical protein